MTTYVEREHNQTTGRTAYYVWKKRPGYRVDDCLKLFYDKDAAIDFARNYIDPEEHVKVSTVIWRAPEPPEPPSAWRRFMDWCSGNG